MIRPGVGRIERPVDPTQPWARLAVWMREIRGDRTLEALARPLGVHPSTLQRALAGRRRLRWPTMAAYAKMRGGNVDKARMLWEMPPRIPAPDPHRFETRSEVQHALPAVREAAGVTVTHVVRTIQIPMSRSHLYQVVQVAAPARTWPVMDACLQACRMPEDQKEEWQRVWNKLLGRHRRAQQSGRTRYLRIQARYGRA